jgi:uncharacterized repeat protein (TIGR01451 family)
LVAFNEKLWLVPRLIVLVCLALTSLGYQPARAAGPWYVAPAGNDANSCLDSADPCATINTVIAKASSGDTVYVAIGTYTGEDPNGVVTIGKDLILSGGWNTGFTNQTGMSIIDGQGARRGVNIDAATGITVMLEYFTIQNGNVTTNFGGGISNSNGNLTINHSLIKNNRGYWQGGGIANAGTLTLNDSIVRDNAAGKIDASGGGGGGGISNSSGSMTINNSAIIGNKMYGNYQGSGIYNSANLTLNNSTISGNTGIGYAIYTYAYLNTTLNLNSSTVADNEGGIFNIYGMVYLQNTILTGNSVSNYQDCRQDSSVGVVKSLGYNLIGTNLGCTLDDSDLTNIYPMLAPLHDNGGPTLTRALLKGSPAFNAGNPAGCQGSAGLLTTDQRGVPRSDRCDIGAFEVRGLDFSDMTVTPDNVPAGYPVTYTITLATISPSGIENAAVTDSLPDTLTYVDGSLTATGGHANYSSGVITWTGPVNAVSTQTITFRATVSQTARGSVIVNQALIESGEERFSRTAAVRVPPPYYAYLPLIIRPWSGFFGHVTINGEGEVGEPLELRFFDGTSWSTLKQVGTNEGGLYYFYNVPSLSSGQAYYVRFVNPGSASSLLAMWYAPLITTYSADQGGVYNDFDIAAVSLISPTPGAQVELPNTFQWAVRPATPTDSYQFELFDPYGSTDFITPWLGYLDNYRLKSRPTGFKLNTLYGWMVWVHSPDGGLGASFYNPITFKRKGSSLFPTLTETAQRNLLERGEELLMQALP